MPIPKPGTQSSGPAPAVVSNHQALWNLWTIWDSSLAELVQPSAECAKRRRMDQADFRSEFLRKFRSLGKSFNFPSDSTMPVMIVEVTGNPILHGHKQFVSIPIIICDFDDVRPPKGNWIIRAHLDLGVLLSLIFKSGEILLILGGIVDYEDNRIILNNRASKPKLTHIIHLADKKNNHPEIGEYPFGEECFDLFVASKLQLLYSRGTNFTILKTVPYYHQSEKVKHHVVSFTTATEQVTVPGAQKQIVVISSQRENISGGRKAHKNIAGLPNTLLSPDKVSSKRTQCTPRTTDGLANGSSPKLQPQVKLLKLNMTTNQGIKIIPETPGTSVRSQSLRVPAEISASKSVIPQSRNSRRRPIENVVQAQFQAPVDVSPSKHTRILGEIEVTDLDDNYNGSVGQTGVGRNNRTKSGNDGLLVVKQLPGGFFPPAGSIYVGLPVESEDEDNSVECNRVPIGSTNGMSVPLPPDPMVGPSKSIQASLNNWNLNWRAIIKKGKDYDYQTLRSIKNKLERESLLMINKQNVYGVVCNILTPDKSTDYKIRISDESEQNVLVRIHTSSTERNRGPEMLINDIIRIHRCCVQREIANRNEMVISTSPHHNYVLFNHDTNVGSHIIKATCAKEITFSAEDRSRVIELRKFILDRRSLLTIIDDWSAGDFDNSISPAQSTPKSRNLQERFSQIIASQNQSQIPNDISENRSSGASENQPPRAPESQGHESEKQSTQSSSMAGILDGLFDSPEQSDDDHQSQNLNVSLTTTYCADSFNVSAYGGTTLLEELDGIDHRRKFSMRCWILASQYDINNGDLFIRVSDGTAPPKKFKFVNLLDDMENSDKLFVDIYIKDIDAMPELLEQLNAAENNHAVWILTKIKIVPSIDQRGWSELVINATECSFRRFREPSVSPIKETHLYDLNVTSSTMSPDSSGNASVSVLPENTTTASGLAAIKTRNTLSGTADKRDNLVDADSPMSPSPKRRSLRISSPDKMTTGSPNSTSSRINQSSSPSPSPSPSPKRRSPREKSSSVTRTSGSIFIPTNQEESEEYSTVPSEMMMMRSRSAIQKSPQKGTNPTQSPDNLKPSSSQKDSQSSTVSYQSCEPHGDVYTRSPTKNEATLDNFNNSETDTENSQQEPDSPNLFNKCRRSLRSKPLNFAGNSQDNSSQGTPSEVAVTVSFDVSPNTTLGFTSDGDDGEHAADLNETISEPDEPVNTEKARGTIISTLVNKFMSK